MQTVSSITSMKRLAKKWRWQRHLQSALIGLVPTMGYLHAGHLSLVREARRRVGRAGRVVVSIYVNPTQFAPTEDLSKYPRDMKRDLKLLRGEGVDVVFAPEDREMYPDRGDLPESFSTYVVEEKLSRSMEGASRPTHFRGVTTVVAKLFNIVQPDVAVFGQKDFQQAAIIRRMTRDLNFPVRVIASPTVREPDGLAMSSRNKYLEGDLRRQALVLRHALDAARTRVKKSKRVEANDLRGEIKKIIEAEPDARLDYVEFFEPETLVPAAEVSAGTQMALAVFVGKTRLIDNDRI
ncbi:MAG TPA: pantoate--beta-alanine ligase [Candidatus Acidoferrales bacterium]|nr:pantoate--beta-alanine ligase [Candidatus Acidoferrales bacterium]